MNLTCNQPVNKTFTEEPTISTSRLINIDLPTIGEITRIFRSINANRPTSVKRKASSSCFSFRKPDKSNNSNKFSSSARPRSTIVKGERHFFCLSSKQRSENNECRKAWSAISAARTSSKRKSKKCSNTQQVLGVVSQQTCNVGVIFQPPELEKEEVIKHLVGERVPCFSANKNSSETVTSSCVESFVDSASNVATNQASAVDPLKNEIVSLPEKESKSIKFVVESFIDSANNEATNEACAVNPILEKNEMCDVCLQDESKTKLCDSTSTVIDQSICKTTVYWSPSKQAIHLNKSPLSKGKTAYMMKSRNFCITTFIEEGTRHAWVNIVIADPFERIKVGKVKEGAGQALGLQPNSLKIFGLFRGLLGDPIELLLDEDNVPDNTSSFSLQRVSFDPYLERMITSTDNVAMEIIFWEAQCMLVSDKIYPLPKDSMVEVMEILLENESSLIPRPNLANQERFLDTIRNSPLYYWSYYYRREDCILEESIMYECHIEKGTKIIVAMNETKLIFIDRSSGEELISWPWNKIRCLKMQNAPKRLFMFEIRIVRESDTLDLISVATDSNHYLYSIGSHIFKIHEARQVEKFPPTSQSAEFSNKIFMRLDGLAERRKMKTRILVEVEQNSGERQSVGNASRS